jgi:hypothetical protein
MAVPFLEYISNHSAYNQVALLIVGAIWLYPKVSKE